MVLTEEVVAKFRRIIYTNYEKYGRHDLPWRTTYTEPYHILVSEIMLQQTTVERVIPKFLEFTTAFPTVVDLATASQSDVLSHWIGLGYNRRGLYLHRAAKMIVEKYTGVVPSDPAELRSLPGIGSYASASIAVFAYNRPEIVIDTNIRTVYIHYFLPGRDDVADKELIPYIESTLDYGNPRRWYSALMDYGVYLKKTVGNISRQSRHYSVQSPLRGSRRELRGAILRNLRTRPLSEFDLIKLIKSDYPTNTNDVKAVIVDLKRDLLIEEKSKFLTLR